MTPPFPRLMRAAAGIGHTFLVRETDGSARRASPFITNRGVAVPSRSVLAKLGGAKILAGYVDPRESATRFFYRKVLLRQGEHVIEQNLSLANEALQPVLGGRELKLLAPQLPVDPTAEAWADSEITRLGIASYAIVNPGAGWGAKQWPAERFGEVAKALAVHNIKTLVNASADESELARAVGLSAPTMSRHLLHHWAVDCAHPSRPHPGGRGYWTAAPCGCAGNSGRRFVWAHRSGTHRPVRSQRDCAAASGKRDHVFSPS